MDDPCLVVVDPCLLVVLVVVVDPCLLVVVVNPKVAKAPVVVVCREGQMSCCWEREVDCRQERVVADCH
jgi:hypothetical protein